MGFRLLVSASIGGLVAGIVQFVILLIYFHEMDSFVESALDLFLPYL